MNNLIFKIVLSLLNLNLITCSENCLDTNDLTSYNKTINPLYSVFERSKPIKCGIINHQLVSNKNSSSKFFISWIFESKTSVKLTFLLENVDNFTQINYYYLIKKFGKDDVATEVNKFDQNNSYKETLLIKYDPLPFHLVEVYDILKNILNVCVVIINLNYGFSFSLPFMCVDIFLDREYYKSLDKESMDHLGFYFRQHSLGTLIVLFPLTIFIYLAICLWHKKHVKSNSFIKEMLLKNRIFNNISISDLYNELSEQTQKENIIYKYNSNVSMVQKNSHENVDHAINEGPSKMETKAKINQLLTPCVSFKSYEATSFYSNKRNANHFIESRV
ncbi:unnamed protein product [Brachionus calyciflorus]|uniref:Uncharacterized protein n=1 Tax=Brachionus calyciflorus TaxID=104777 RepID=A0A813M5I6_9BILA|nr:unnamed protein product [Brachionus calyciflorus]